MANFPPAIPDNSKQIKELKDDISSLKAKVDELDDKLMQRITHLSELIETIYSRIVEP